MNLKYSKEHNPCFNYDNGKEPLVEIIKTDSKTQGEVILNHNTFIYVTARKAKFSYEAFTDVVVDKIT